MPNSSVATVCEYRKGQFPDVEFVHDPSISLDLYFLGRVNSLRGLLSRIVKPASREPELRGWTEYQHMIKYSHEQKNQTTEEGIHESANRDKHDEKPG
ncbi:hypothetical protein AGMMS50256_24610 [Betaproteobacteria bacterium]|nr:hypothetical protein AGMMS50256_24610 [Betaproteobacteria bacterium]